MWRKSFQRCWLSRKIEYSRHAPPRERFSILCKFTFSRWHQLPLSKQLISSSSSSSYEFFVYRSWRHCSTERWAKLLINWASFKFEYIRHRVEINHASNWIEKRCEANVPRQRRVGINLMQHRVQIQNQFSVNQSETLLIYLFSTCSIGGLMGRD